MSDVINKIFVNLNTKQLEAVKTIDGPVLVISGPGSGKTKCLTHRVAYLITKGIKPENILCLTFTNKASKEIKERVLKLLSSSQFKTLGNQSSQNAAQPTIGTFHSVGLKILRQDINYLGYKNNFTILDEEDQEGLIKRIMAELELDTKKFNPRIIINKISQLKTNFIEPAKASSGEFFEEIVKKIYHQYQNELKRLNAVDFDDLIVLCVKIFETNKNILTKYQKLWKYILVDEYQDTSRDQYRFITLLAKTHKNLFCIGDDAQSIYQFRRADIRNILNFHKDYPNAKIIILEQNYRSTKNIITAASHLISHNKNQVPKELWTDNEEGEEILIKELLSEQEEARFVVSKIKEFLKKGKKPHDIVVLYRAHYQSRAIEEGLIMSGLPYHIVGGIKFYERREIKDILAYLKFITNTSDLISFERIFNIPPRGIGKAAFERILKENPHNILEGIKSLASSREENKFKQLTAIKMLALLLEDLIEKSENYKPTKFLKYLIQEIKYEEYLKQSGSRSREEAEERIENLKELIAVASKYDRMENCSEGILKLLEEIALLQDLDKIKNSENKITLMTAHASKGLEFPVVFIIGLEEGLFPHSKTLINPNEVEEERRLCYVAMTRAKEKLIMTFARHRNSFGIMQTNLPSRFIGEIPSQLASFEISSDYSDGEQEEKIFY
jgi:DNA helicase-2/ATP-dependent DNA helicase PcrA